MIHPVRIVNRYCNRLPVLNTLVLQHVLHEDWASILEKSWRHAHKLFDYHITELSDRILVLCMESTPIQVNESDQLIRYGNELTSMNNVGIDHRGELVPDLEF